MSHPHEQMLREPYGAFARGDLDGYLTHCTDDIVFHVPGRGKVAGTYARDQFASSMIKTVIDLTHGTFRETVLDVVANERRGVVLALHEMDRGSGPISYRTAHIYAIRDGKLAEFREYPEDLYAFDAAWA